MPSLLQTDNVSLRPIENSDLPLMYRLENDTALWDTTSFAQPISRSTLETFLNATTGNIYTDHQLRLVIEYSEPDKENISVGFIDLSDFSPRHLRAEVGIAVVQEYRNIGIGSQALCLIEQYAKQMLMLHQLYAYVSPTNDISCKLFANAGYQVVGTLGDWMKTMQGYRPLEMLQKIL